MHPTHQLTPVQNMFLWISLGLLVPSPSVCLRNDPLHTISKRFVLFQQYSVLQITTGVSVPVIFPKRLINFSLCFNLSHDLPYNLSNFEPLYGRQNAEAADNIDFDRKTMYEYIVSIVEALGLDGEACLLRTICEVSETPLHIQGEDSDGDNLLEQILHFLLTPSTDFGNHNFHVNTTLEHKVLIAERLGRVHGECYKIFRCPISLLDLFTNKYY